MDELYNMTLDFMQWFLVALGMMAMWPIATERMFKSANPQPIEEHKAKFKREERSNSYLFSTL